MTGSKLLFRGGSITLVRNATNLALKIEIDGQPAVELPVQSDTLRDFFRDGTDFVGTFQRDMELVGGLLRPRVQAPIRATKHYGPRPPE